MSERHTSEAVAHESRTVHVERSAAYATALKLRAAHTGTHSLYDEASLQFGNGGYDDDDGATQRAIGVDGFALGQELNAKLIKLVEDLEEMFGRSGQAIGRPDQNGVELTAIGILQELVQRRTSHFRPADAMINVFMDDLIASLARELAQFNSLGFRILING
jgi:hypothetical protein